MAAVTSSSSNASSLSAAPPRPVLDSYSSCVLSPPSSFIFIFYSVVNVLLLLPLCTFVIYEGVRRWRTRSSSPSAAVSNLDVFTYHLVVMETIDVVGSVCNCAAASAGDWRLLYVGRPLTYFTWYGEIYFHTLTCVERHLAVVHPVAYLRLRSRRGTQIRDASIALAWLLSAAAAAVWTAPQVLYLDISMVFASLGVVSFCSLSVLRVLLRPGPGERGGARVRAEPARQRAFCTILAILGVLAVRFGSDMFWISLMIWQRSADCLASICLNFLDLPCNAVLPLLYLHRAGLLRPHLSLT